MWAITEAQLDPARSETLQDRQDVGEELCVVRGEEDRKQHDAWATDGELLVAQARTVDAEQCRWRVKVYHHLNELAWDGPQPCGLRHRYGNGTRNELSSYADHGRDSHSFSAQGCFVVSQSCRKGFEGLEWRLRRAS